MPQGLIIAKGYILSLKSVLPIVTSITKHMKISMRLISTDNHCSKYFLKVTLISMISILIIWLIKKPKSNFLFKNSVPNKEKIESKELLYKLKIYLLNLQQKRVEKLDMEPKLYSDMLSPKNIFAASLRLPILERALSNYNCQLNFPLKFYSKFDHIELTNMKEITFIMMTASNFIIKVQIVTLTSHQTQMILRSWIRNNKKKYSQLRKINISNTIKKGLKLKNHQESVFQSSTKINQSVFGNL